MSDAIREPLRVAFFNPIFPHYRSALLRELRSNGAFDYSWFADDHDSYGNIPVLALSGDAKFHRCSWIRIFGRFSWQSGTIRIALFGDFDAYIFEGDAQYLSSWAGALLARIRGKRVLFWSHGWTRIDTGLKRLVRLSFYRLAHGLLLYGNRARRIGIDFGLPGESLYVMYNSLDPDLQRTLMDSITADEQMRLRAKLCAGALKPIVIATARLTAKKRFDLLIRAVALVNRRAPAVHLLVVGDGPARGELEELAFREGVAASFIGACYEERALAHYFSVAAVTVSPGDVGLTCMHSLGFGVPVITHDDADNQMPEWEAVIPGVTGDTFERDDVDDLARKIEQWTTSPAVTANTRVACLERVKERYHPRQQARAIELALTGDPATSATDAALCAKGG